MNVSFDLPQDIEQQLRSEGVYPNREAKQVYLMEQFRQARITHRQLGGGPGLKFPRDRAGTEAAGDRSRPGH